MRLPGRKSFEPTFPHTASADAQRAPSATRASLCHGTTHERARPPRKMVASRLVEPSQHSREPLLALRAELGASLPPEVEALPDEALEHLLACVRAQKAHQRGALDTAVEQGLTFVPAMLRGAVRKILFKG